MKFDSKFRNFSLFSVTLKKFSENFFLTFLEKKTRIVQKNQSRNKTMKFYRKCAFSVLFSQFYGKKIKSFHPYSIELQNFN